jgi:hypothetical protein
VYYSTSIVSRVGTGAGGAPSLSSCFRPSISKDGNRIVYDTVADMVNGPAMGGDTNGRPDVYMRVVNTNVTTRISKRFDVEPNGNSNFAWIAGGGGFVAFTSTSSNIATDAMGNPVTDANAIEPDVFRASVGLPFSIEIVTLNNDNPPVQSFFDFTYFTTGSTRVGRVISDDGQRVVFSGAPCDWDVGQCPQPDHANCLCPQPGGNCAGCLSFLKQGVSQIYLRDFSIPQTFRVSRLGLPLPQASFEAANNHCRDPALFNNGQSVAFSTFATNLLGDTDIQEDVFVFAYGESDMLNCPLFNAVRFSKPLGPPGTASNGHSSSPMVFGLVAVFQSSASNLVSNDRNGFTDVFLARFDGDDLVVERMSVGVSGTGIEPVQANNHSFSSDVALPSIGEPIVVYVSSATNLIDDDTNGVRDAFETRNLPFIRGDADGDGQFIQQLDGDFLIAFLFAAGPPPPCMDAADFNDDGFLDQSDPLWGYQFPLMPPNNCLDVDLTVDQITCRSYPPCGN